MAREFFSPVFGTTTRDASEQELQQIAGLVETVPVSVLNAINRRLHARGFLISIGTLQESGEKPH